MRDDNNDTHRVFVRYSYQRHRYWYAPHNHYHYSYRRVPIYANYTYASGATITLDGGAVTYDGNVTTTAVDNDTLSGTLVDSLNDDGTILYQVRSDSTQYNDLFFDYALLEAESAALPPSQLPVGGSSLLMLGLGLMPLAWVARHKARR